MSFVRQQGRPVFGVALLAAALIALLVAVGQASTSTDTSTWIARMQALTQVLESLMPVLVKTDVPSTTDTELLRDGSEKLVSLAHAIAPADAARAATDTDPSIGILSALLANQAQEARRAVNAEQYEAARAILRSAIEQCIGCHTRSERDSNHPTVTPLQPPPSLDLLQRADFYSATRQFDRAFEAYLALARDPGLAAHQTLNWQRAVRRGLDVTVRVKRDPHQAAVLIDAALALPHVPPFLVERLTAWRKAIAAWGDERRTKPQDVAWLLTAARKQLDAARAQQQFPMDHDADVLFLRASASAHGALSAGAKGLDAAEALSIGGMAYELLADPGQAFLPEQYFEACIRQAPRTRLARQCLERYESRVFFLHSGSGGASLPEPTEETLEQLRALAR